MKKLVAECLDFLLTTLFLVLVILVFYGEFIGTTIPETIINETLQYAIFVGIVKLLLAEKT